MTALRSAGTICSNLTKNLVLALLPVVAIGGWQGVLAYRDSADVVAQRLRANAWAIAESERDPFIIARHSLQMIGEMTEVRAVRNGCEQALADARSGATGVANFIRTDRDGTVRCSAIPFRPGLSLAPNPSWQEARSRRTFFLGRPAIGEVSGQPVIQLFLPLWTDSGAFDGTTSAEVSLTRISRTLAARQRQLGGAILLVDRQGRVLAGAATSHFDAIPSVSLALTAPQVLESRDGKRWTYAAAPMFERELLVVYAEPQSNLADAALSRIWLILALPILAILLTVAGVWFAVRRHLLVWFRRLQQMTRQIAEATPIGGLEGFSRAPAEFAAMAQDLHNMAGSLTAGRMALQRALDVQTDLTRELNHRVRNNIQIIVSLLTMQAEKVPEGWVRDTLDQARARVSALGLVHRFMYEQGELQVAEVPAAELLADLCAQIRKSSRSEVRLRLERDPSTNCRIALGQAVPVMLFALEAITIAAARSVLPGTVAGEVLVSLTSDPAGCLLVVSDEQNDACSALGDRELLEALADQAGGQCGADCQNGQHRTWLRFPAD